MLQLDPAEFFIDRKVVSRPSGRGTLSIYRVNLRAWVELVGLSRAMDGEKSRRRLVELQTEFLRIATGMKTPRPRDLVLFPEAYRFNFPLPEAVEEEKRPSEKETRDARENLFRNLFNSIEPLLIHGVALDEILDRMNIFQVIIRANGLEREKWNHYAENLRIVSNRNKPDELLEYYQNAAGRRVKTFSNLAEAAEFAKKQAEKKKKQGGNHAR